MNNLSVQCSCGKGYSLRLPRKVASDSTVIPTPIATELVPCLCGKGLLVVDVRVRDDGKVAYSTEAVHPCASCGSIDIASARAKRPPPR